MNTTEDTKTDVINSNGSASTNGKTGGESGPVENAKVKNKEAILTGGMGYGRKKRQALDAFWSILWPGLEKIGWKRIVGEGSDEGSMIFLPPGIIAMRRGKRNIEYFDRIKLVIEFLEERRSKAEGKILDLYRKEIPATGGDAVASNPKRVGGRPRLRVSRSSIKDREIEEIDTSWKDGRCLYPKRSSKIGKKHQVSSLPRAGTFENKSVPDNRGYELIWNWKEAAEKGMLNFIEENVPSNKREKALELMHKSNYVVSNIKGFSEQIDASNSLQWTKTDREKFHEEIFRSRKNFKSVLQNMGKTNMGDVIAYYLGHYKKSDDYRLLKAVRSQEREEKANQTTHAVDHCAICGEGGSLLICDGCESEWHMGCSKPALKAIPEGHWECDICVDRKFLEGRKRILENVKMNASDQPSGKREKLGLPQGSDIGSKRHDQSMPWISFPPDVFDAIKDFSRNVNSILSTATITLKSEEDLISN